MVETKLTYNPDFAMHPGETLREELETANISQVELTQRTGISEKHISQIINGEASITPDTAIKLERSLGVPAEFWANLQKNYDVTVARIESDRRLAKEMEESKRFRCYEELISVGCIKPAQNLKEKAENLLSFFGVDSLTYLPQTEAVAFRQTRGKFEERSLAAWLRCGEIEASKLEVGSFNKMRVREIIPEIKKLTLLPEGFGNKLQELCATAGIAVVFSPYFKRTRVNGSTRWIGDKAVIQLNTKGAYSDIFWFTFFHELGHVMLHGVKERFLEYDGRTKDDKEREADEFAVKNLIPESEYEMYIRSGQLSRITAERFAKSVGIDVSIVLGRLAHEGRAPWRQIAHGRSRLLIQP